MRQYTMARNVLLRPIQAHWPRRVNPDHCGETALAKTQPSRLACSHAVSRTFVIGTNP
jgi:hypothetical protein